MADNFFLKADAAGGGAGTEGSPFNSLLQAAPGGNFAGDTNLWLHPGLTIPAVFGGSWTLPAGANLTIRPYGSGDGRPSVTFTGNGFLCQGSGSADYQDIDLYGTSGGSAIIARTGGNARAVNCDFHNFATSIKCGTGVIEIDNVWCNKPSRNGFQADAAADAAICSSVRMTNFRATAASPTAQDLLVLHAGGYGVCNDVILDGIIIEALGTAYIESGIDFQEDFANVTLRNFEITGASQWGVVMGNLFKTARQYVFNTKSQMLARFTREGIGSGVEDINGGHCCFVTADGGNNGIWQLTGNDPNISGSWTGPMTPQDLADTVGHRIYSGILRRCVAGIQVQHPGTQIRGVNAVETTLGNWIGESSSGTGNTLSIYPFGYDVHVDRCNLSSLNGKYPEIVSAGPGEIGVPSGNYLTSTKAAVRVQTLNTNIPQTTRLTLTNSIVRQRAYHTGPFIELQASADRGYVDSDYNAYVDETTLRTDFADDAGTDRTFSAFKTSNGNSDANSQFITTATALIDDDGTLLDGSPLIGAGSAVTLDAPNVDVNGETAHTPPDIGADNYLSEAEAEVVVPTQRRKLRAQRSDSVPPVDSDPPAVPTGLTFVFATAVSVTMVWGDTALASYHELRYSPTGAGTWTVTAAVVSDLSTVIDNLQSGADLDVQIRAGNAAGVSDWSATVAAVTADGVWFLPQRDGNEGGFADMPALVERFMETGATSNPDAYGTAGVYTLLTDNGGAGGGVALVAVDDNTARRMDAVLSMQGMVSGNQWIITFKASHELSTAQSFYWAYGAHSSIAAMYGLHVSAADVITFTSRGLGAGTSTNTPLTRDSGPVFGDFDGEGEYLIIISIRATSTTEVSVEVRMVHETVGTSVWSASGIDCSDGAGASALPGILPGQTAAEHGGLMLGARMRSISLGSGLPEKNFGIGTGHVATLGTFQARKHDTYSAAAIDAAVDAASAAPDGLTWWMS